MLFNKNGLVEYSQFLKGEKTICLTRTHSQRSSEEYYDNLQSVKEFRFAPKMIPPPSDLIFL